jgi:hypothetical protein
VSSAQPDIEPGHHEPQEPGPVEVLPRQTARDTAARVITEVLAPWVIVLLLPIAVAWQATHSPAHMILWGLLVSLTSSILPMGGHRVGSTHRPLGQSPRPQPRGPVRALPRAHFLQPSSFASSSTTGTPNSPTRSMSFSPRPASGCCAPPLPRPRKPTPLPNSGSCASAPRVHRPATDFLPTPSANRHEDLHRPLQ